MYSIFLRIKEKADTLGLSGKELGALLGLKKSPLTDWKNGKSSPTLEQLKKMCEIFAVSADYLLFGKESERLLLPKNTSAETELLFYFYGMGPDDQKELLMIAEMKYNKETKRLEAKEAARLSHSKDEMLA